MWERKGPPIALGVKTGLPPDPSLTLPSSTEWATGTAIRTFPLHELMAVLESDSSRTVSKTMTLRSSNGSCYQDQNQWTTSVSSSTINSQSDSICSTRRVADPQGTFHLIVFLWKHHSPPGRFYKPSHWLYPHERTVSYQRNWGVNLVTHIWKHFHMFTQRNKEMREENTHRKYGCFFFYSETVSVKLHLGDPRISSRTVSWKDWLPVKAKYWPSNVFSTWVCISKISSPPKVQNSWDTWRLQAGKYSHFTF